jgi:uncharacterized protein (DUF488 family)
MLTVFFTSRELFVLDAMLKGQKYTLDYFVRKVVPEVQSERSRFARRKTMVVFAVYMDNSLCHRGKKATNILDKENVIPVPYLVYSPDLSPCDFWLFGM